MSYRWLLLLCLLLPLSALAASVQASLDRNDVHLGDTVTLNLRIDGSMNANTPDLSVLENDFDVLGSSTNSSLSVVNGRQSMQLVIGIALRPKHVGDLQIPSLSVAGGQTSPLILHVGAPDTSASASTQKDVFVETSVNPDHVYVGQQFSYVVRLFFDVNLNSGTLPDPHPDGVEVRRLGGDTDYETMRGTRRYHVIERRYALIPQRAGALTIPAIEFQGEAVETGNPNDPGSFFGQGGLFGNTTPVTADSPAANVNVQAAPADWGSTAWLPARSLALKLDGLPGNDQAQVGQPVNLRMSIEALGLTGDVLPDLSLPNIDGATVYPDQSTNTTHDDGQWLTGFRQRSFAIFPQHAGTLTIPAISLTWFNVQTGQKQVATIPAHTLTVAAAAGGAPAASASAAQNASAVAAPAAAGSAAAPLNASATASSAVPWRWLAIGSLGLWLLSAVVFWWSRRRASVSPVSPSGVGGSESVRSSRHAFMEAARGKDRSTQARRLLAWARSERPGLQNLGQVSAALASDAQRAAIDRLQRLQYASASGEDATDLAAVFAHGFAWRSDTPAGNDSPLPPLYPFKLD
ncbi:BatD family protein [Dyella acidiphila]|uniref:Protein BatD n=1 Tax=Dyella acidiphila TaxID=2775866 RepID=A0ABR9G4F7_9GAMM|nr:BatD family protein [Dyella acidiphila]MBE1158931.1 protein BatD [Dyella acidiphila]